MQTGNGIPSALLQEKNKGTGEDLKAEAARKAEALRAADKSNLKIGEKKDFTASASNITPAKTPQEIAAWKASIGKPGAGRFNETAAATVSKEGTNNITPKGVVNFSNEIKASEMPSSAKIPMAKAPGGRSWFRSDTNQKFAGNTSFGISGSFKNRISEGQRKQSIDTDPKITSQGRPFSTGENNEFKNTAFTDQETKLYDRGRIGIDDNPFGKDPVKHKNRLNALESQLDKNDQTVASRTAATATKQAEAIAAKKAKIEAEKGKRNVKSPNKQLKNKNKKTAPAKMKKC